MGHFKWFWKPRKKVLHSIGMGLLFKLTLVNNKWFSNALWFGNFLLHLLHLKAPPTMVKSWWQSIKWFHCSASLMEIGILQYEQISCGKLEKFIGCRGGLWEFEFHIFLVVNLSKNWNKCSQRTANREKVTMVNLATKAEVGFTKKVSIILEKFGSQQHFSTRILLTVLILKEFVSYFVYFV